MISWSALGHVQEQLGNISESKRAYEKALEATRVIGHVNGIKGVNEALIRVGS